MTMQTQPYESRLTNQISMKAPTFGDSDVRILVWGKPGDSVLSTGETLAKATGMTACDMRHAGTGTSLDLTTYPPSEHIIVMSSYGEGETTEERLAFLRTQLNPAHHELLTFDLVIHATM